MDDLVLVIYERGTTSLPKWSTYENYLEYPGGRAGAGWHPLVLARHERPAWQFDDGPTAMDSDRHHSFRGWDCFICLLQPQESLAA